MVSVSTDAEEAKLEPQKFLVKYTIQYNAITLGDAAAKEMHIRHLFEDACSVDVGVEKSNTFYFHTVEVDISE